MFFSQRFCSIVVTLVLSASVSACGGSSASTRETKPVASSDTSCPAAVPGTSVTAEDTDTGAALVFVTTGDVADLRRRAAAMAKMHNDHHSSMGALPDGTEGGGGHDMSSMGGGHSGHDMSGHDMGKMGSGSATPGHDMSKMGSGSGASGHDMSKMGSGSGASGHDMSKMGSGGNADGGMMIGVHAKATAADIDGGARIVFTAAGPDVAKLQGELRMHAQHLASGSCVMGAR